MSLLFKYNYGISSDEELMFFISKGKEKAFDEIYKRYAKKMLFFFYSKLYKDEEKANDFLQDLFLKIIEYPEKFDVTKTFSTWIYTVAYNMCKNEYRKHEVNIVNGYDLSLISEEGETNYIDKYDGLFFRQELGRHLNGLDEKKRTTFILKYQQYLSIKEISIIMGCSEGTVKSRLFYCIKSLSKQLNIFNPKA